MEEQEIYKNDVFGLKTVHEAGKIKFATLPGNQMQKMFGLPILFSEILVEKIEKIFFKLNDNMG